MTSSQEVEIEGQRLKLVNLDKVFYPKADFSKGQVLDYYLRIAPVLLPHLRDRPLTLKRYPNGVEGEHFYEKNCPSHRPPWVKTAPIWSDQSRKVMQFCLVQDLATLAWVVNLADLEMHVPLHRARDVGRPDSVVFDLDPGAPADLVTCCEVAVVLHDTFARLGLHSFVKTSGSKGLQLYVPLNGRETYDETKPFARAVADALAAQRPALVVSNMKKSLRAGKVLVDWSQNDPHKTTVCVYSLRARERPTVSTPVTWDEVRRCLRKRDPALLSFETDAALRRAREQEDLFKPLLTLKQRLPAFGAAAHRAERQRKGRPPARPPQPFHAPRKVSSVRLPRRRAGARRRSG